MRRSVPQELQPDQQFSFQYITRLVIRMGLPAFMASALVFGMNLLNFGILAAFGDYKDIASYGIISAYTNLAAGFFIPLAAGTGYMLERAEKANDPQKTQAVISTSMLLAVFLGIISTIFANLITPWYIWQVVTPEEIKETTTIFYRVFSLTFTPILFFSVSTTILIHLGERTAPIFAEISAMVLHASFSYIFVGLFGWDMRGIAISAIVAQSTGSLINVYLVLRQRSKYLSKSKIRFDWSIVRELAKEERTVEFVAVLAGVFAIFLQFYIDELGIKTIAGFALFFMLQDAVFIPIHALRSPARNLSAQYYELDGNNALVKAINPVLILASIYCLVMIPIARFVGPHLFMLFSHDAEVTEIGMMIHNLMGPFYIFYALSTLLSSSLEGLGKKGTVMNFNIVFNYFVRFTLLILGAMIIQGQESIALCYPASWFLSAAALSVYYFASYSKTGKYSL